jgi:hypothetical protein
MQFHDRAAIPTPQRSRPTRRRCAALFALAGLAAPACSRDGVRDIPETRTVTPAPLDPSRPPSSAERFGFTMGEAPAAGHVHDAPPARFAWSVPPGWRESAPTPMRQANFAVDGAPDLECYLTVLPGGGGGIDANLARWRKQMSVGDEAPDDHVQAMQRPVLGQPATWVEYRGTYRGMGGEVERAGSMLIGVALLYEGDGVFWKMVGPQAAVEGERERFRALVESMTAAAAPAAPVAAASGPAGGGSAAAPAPAAPTGPAPGLSWSAPPHWRVQPERPMRLVSFAIGSSGATECYVAVLAGAAGGTAANINRWRDQMGQPELTEAEFAALPRLPMLGRQAPLVAIDGHFTGMDGATTSDAMLLGAVCELPEEAVFVKLVGPAAEVRAERQHFEAFCRSLR